MKLTGWYQGDQRPVRVGFYLRDTGGNQINSWFDGRYWLIVGGTHKSIYQNLPWLGVAK